MSELGKLYNKEVKVKFFDMVNLQVSLITTAAGKEMSSDCVPSFLESTLVILS